MKAISILLAIIFLLVAVFAAAGGKHDFTDGVGNDYWYSGKNACELCHATLVKPSETVSPLWDKQYEIKPFQLYKVSPLNDITSDSFTSSTKMCIGCHDGSIGPVVGMFNHPVGITYESLKRNLKPSEAIDLPLYKGKLECQTCHNAHAEDVMRVTDEICFHCHLQ